MKNPAFFGIDWQVFGLKKNPYSLRPLQDGGDVSIDKLFVGRENEREMIDKYIASEDQGCFVICGDAGVGKTSLINFEKFIWKTSRPNLFFSAKRELEASLDKLTKQKFLLNVISAIVREIKLIDPSLERQESFIKDLSRMVDNIFQYERSVSLHVGVPGVSAGLDLTKNLETNNPLQLTDTLVESKFFDLIDFIRTHEINGRKFQGIIVHINNFDIVMKEDKGKQRILSFFHEIRDLLQTEHVFFFFIGPNNFFEEIIAKEPRVRSIFYQHPIVLKPLTKTHLIDAVRARLDAFKSDTVTTVIAPVKDAVIYKFYDLYNGDVRSIFSSLNDLLQGIQDEITEPLDVDEAMALLSKLRSERFSDLSKSKKEVIRVFIEHESPITQTQIASILKKQVTNVISDVKPLRERGIVEVVKEEGKYKFFDFTADYKCLREYQASYIKIKEETNKVKKQLMLDI